MMIFQAKKIKNSEIPKDVENIENLPCEARKVPKNSCTRPSVGADERTISNSPSATSCDRLAENYTINPKINNHKIIKSIDRVSDSANPRSAQNVEKADRTNYKPMKFAEIMEALGLKWYEMTANEPKTEKYFDERDEISRHTQQCKIPYALKNDKRNMKAALRFLCGYSYYFKDSDTNEKEEQRRTLWETMICFLAEMTEGEYVSVRGKRVMYYEIIDRINEIISRSYLSECFIGFEDEWRKIVSEKELTHPKAYLKSCLWNWLCDFEFEDYNDMSKLR